MDTTTPQPLGLTQDDTKVIRQALSIGHIYPQAWQLLKERWKDFLKLALAWSGLQIAFLMAGITLTAIATTLAGTAGPVKIPMYIVAGLIGLAVFAGLLWSMFVSSMAFTRLFYEDRTEGKFWWTVLKTSAPTAHRYAWAVLLQSLAAKGGVLLLFVGQFYVAIRCLFTPYVFIDRHEGGLQAVQASSDLTRGKFWRLVLVLYVPLLIAVPVCGLAGFALFAMAKALAVIVFVLMWLAAIIVMGPLLMCVNVVTYRELKTLPVMPDPNPKRTRTILIVLIILGILTMPFSFTNSFRNVQKKAGLMPKTSQDTAPSYQETAP